MHVSKKITTKYYFCDIWIIHDAPKYIENSYGHKI